MDGTSGDTEPHVNDLPVEALTAILSYLPDPAAPLDDNILSRRHLSLPKTPTISKDGNIGRLGWLIAAWVCQQWRNVVLSQTRYRIPILLDDELAPAILESLAPLSADLHINEEQWQRNENATLRVQTFFRSYGHRLRSVYVWTIHEARIVFLGSHATETEALSDSSELLPNVMRGISASFIEEFHAVGQTRHLRGGCLLPGHRDLYPRAVAIPLGLSRNLRILDLSYCTITNASGLQTCAPIYAKLLACPGIWDNQNIDPDPGVITDRDDVSIERFSVPFMFHNLRSLYLDEDSLPSREAISALGSITLPILEQLHLSGLVSPVQDTLNVLVFPRDTTVTLRCAWDRYTGDSMDIRDLLDADISSIPFCDAFATKYLKNAAASAPFVSSIRLVIGDVDLTLKLCSSNGQAIVSVHLYYNAQWARDFQFRDPELFLSGMFSIFPDIRELSVSGFFKCEMYSGTDELRRCRWYAVAAQKLTDLTRLVLSSQASLHFLEFYKETHSVNIHYTRPRMLIGLQTSLHFTSPVNWMHQELGCSMRLVLVAF